MSLSALGKIFKPRRIAVLGGNWRPGRDVLENLLGAGFQGAVYPIDSRRESIDGIPTYPGIDTLPHPPDVALICTPANQAPRDVETCARAGVRGVVILSEGFRETGPQGQRLEQEIARVILDFPGLRVLGPNSLGYLAPRLGLNASHGLPLPAAGRLAFLSESRVLCGSVIDWAAKANVGFSYVVSMGNMLDVGFGDLIDYFSTDSGTRAIILYLQSVGNARRFMSAASAFARKKPIVAYKAGRFPESARVAASHTGAMIGEDAVYDAAFARAGIVRVTELDDVFDVAEILASRQIPHRQISGGARLAIVGNAGGPAIIATDVLLARGGALAALAPETVERLDAMAPSIGCRAINPVDLQDSAPPERFADALRIVLADPGVDGVLMIFAVRADIDAMAIAGAVAEVAQVTQGAKKPVLATWMGGGESQGGIAILKKAGIPVHASPEQAVRAFLYLVSYAGNIDTLYQTPRDIPIHFDLNRAKLRKRLVPLLQKSSHILNEYQAEAFLRAYGIPVTENRIAHTPEDALSFAQRVGYPIVLKVLSSKILHKLDVGGVALDLRTPYEVEDAYHAIRDKIQTHWRGRDVKGIIAQKMVKREYGMEMILGAKKDPAFGPVIMVGRGGFATDVILDRQLGLPPLNERLASRMLASLRCWPLLRGYRGRPGLAVDRLIEIMIRFSALVSDYPEIREFDVNPVLVGVEDVLVLDASVILDAKIYPQCADTYEHMAIRPYPEECIRQVTLREGARVTFRPVKPEDEPMWHRLIACSSEQSIRQRFHVLFRDSTHQMAVEYCAVDYERGIAIVAETQIDGERELIGTAHLFADAGLDNAEYAVIVSDPWQGQGLGGMLLDYCLELAGLWGIEQVLAETQLGNKAMLTNFLSRGFVSEADYEDGVVYLKKTIISR